MPFQTNTIQSNHIVDDFLNYLNAVHCPPMPLNGTTLTFELNLQDFGRGVGVGVVTCARATLSAYMGSKNDVGGDKMCSVNLPTLCEYKTYWELVKHDAQHQKQNKQKNKKNKKNPTCRTNCMYSNVIPHHKVVRFFIILQSRWLWRLTNYGFLRWELVKQLKHLIEDLVIYFISNKTMSILMTCMDKGSWKNNKINMFIKCCTTLQWPVNYWNMEV